LRGKLKIPMVDVPLKYAAPVLGVAAMPLLIAVFGGGTISNCIVFAVFAVGIYLTHKAGWKARYGFGTLLATFLVFALMTLITYSTLTPQERAERDARYTAAVAAQLEQSATLGGGPLCDRARYAVTQQLKDPSSASFGHCDDFFTDADKTHGVAVGRITSKNSFNANVTNSYSAEMVRTKGKNDWHVISVEFN
jgi:hypothetical protein